jgi:hypothetical protein
VWSRPGSTAFSASGTRRAGSPGELPGGFGPEQFAAASCVHAATWKRADRPQARGPSDGGRLAAVELPDLSNFSWLPAQ